MAGSAGLDSNPATVTVQDNGEPGTLDTFGLSVTGTKNETRSQRIISRGNIQFHF